jgi:acetyl-CoA carboxylase biotin carboxylase subunit
MKNISRVLIANRGEIAVRIIKACKALGIESVAAVSEVDKESLPAKMADRVVCIGPSRPVDSYLKIETIIKAALGTRSDAVHPGYGFLAEQPELAEACKKYGLIFIGPKPDHIRQMGNKLIARQIVKEQGIPVIPGSEKIKDLKKAIKVAEEIGFPVLLKAAAGGGGRGMRIATSLKDLKTAFEVAANEAYSAFGDETLYIEKYITNARHIEVQIIADFFGNILHLGERDCSIQRRFQKIIEETPAHISKELREEIQKAGVIIAKNIKYENAGTVEFILDQDTGKFYFMEMNTRLQVEHPITEAVSGIDLVKEQIRVAAHLPLSLTQSEVKLEGHAIECRINAEAPQEQFRPCPGKILNWLPPQDLNIRVDSYCYQGYFVPPYYDSLIAKVIAIGNDRLEAINNIKNALDKFIITGIDTTIPLLRFLLNQPDYKKGKINTLWVETILGRLLKEGNLN